jgi:hypothetical protein
MLLALMLGADFSNASNVMTPEVVEQVQEMYEERYDEIQEANAELNKVYGNIFVGDKRFLDLDEDCEISDDEKNFVIADKDADYYWLRDEALDQIEDIVEEHSDIDEWTIVLNLGMNDWYDLAGYTNIYTDLAEKYNICCVNVMPIDNSIDSYTNDDGEKIQTSNNRIKEFNSSISTFVTTQEQINEIKKNDKKVWLLTMYSLLESNGYTTEEDGISYNEDTNKYIYEFISMCLNTYYLPYQK